VGVSSVSTPSLLVAAYTRSSETETSRISSKRVKRPGFTKP